MPDPAGYMLKTVDEAFAYTDAFVTVCPAPPQVLTRGWWYSASRISRWRRVCWLTAMFLRHWDLKCGERIVRID